MERDSILSNQAKKTIRQCVDQIGLGRKNIQSEDDPATTFRSTQNRIDEYGWYSIHYRIKVVNNDPSVEDYYERVSLMTDLKENWTLDRAAKRHKRSIAVNMTHEELIVFLKKILSAFQVKD